MYELSDQPEPVPILHTRKITSLLASDQIEPNPELHNLPELYGLPPATTIDHVSEADISDDGQFLMTVHSQRVDGTTMPTHTQRGRTQETQDIPWYPPSSSPSSSSDPPCLNIIASDELSGEMARALLDLLTKHASAISLHDLDVGYTALAEHGINTQDNSPIHARPYRYSPKERRDAIDRVTEFETAGWVEPSIGPWASPVVLVPKKDGTTRFCVDYRALNNITVKDVYPLPRIDQLLDTLGQARVFSKVDLRHGYYHIPMKEEDKEKTAFILYEGTWQWTRCPMGVCNAPATFQRCMNTVF
jgi:hypothetical protein